MANRSVVDVLKRELDAGEAEALALGLEERAALVLLDEREARRVAQVLKLPVTGALSASC